MTTEPDIPEDEAFQHKVWSVQRWGWVLLGLALACALVGLTGRGGPLATERTAAPFGWVEAPRVGRTGALVSVDIRLDDRTGTGLLTLDRAFLDAFDIEDVQPRPDSQTAGAAGLSLALRAAPGGTLRLQVRPRSAGIARYGLSVGGTAVHLSTLVLP